MALRGGYERGRIPLPSPMPPESGAPPHNTHPTMLPLHSSPLRFPFSSCSSCSAPYPYPSPSPSLYASPSCTTTDYSLPLSTPFLNTPAVFSLLLSSFFLLFSFSFLFFLLLHASAPLFPFISRPKSARSLSLFLFSFPSLSVSFFSVSLSFSFSFSSFESSFSFFLSLSLFLSFSLLRPVQFRLLRRTNTNRAPTRDRSTTRNQHEHYQKRSP